ncbi:hypothetical protein Pint_10188 [Pistacia integerrima]|uniref:Uncharacterized protein n=1 Tax=Pistacia integerrima TaxID=434235 RepID=A0ACC0XL23_9ROSI|nr:hypothetical protein Pint_10188 [Pistacia integerrima]
MVFNAAFDQNLPYRQQLIRGNSHLTGDTLPISLSLNVEANQLSGPVPEEELSSNYFSGRLPIKLAKLKNMKKFRISDNIFTGTVPEFIGGWTNLEMLEMYSSGLEGPIPAAIFSLGSLE